MKVKSESEVAQLCPALHDLMDCSLPGSSAHGISQAGVLEWGAIAFSRLSEEALQIAEKRREAKGKGEKKRCIHLKAEFQRTARRLKKAFLSDQCKEIEKKNKQKILRNGSKNIHNYAKKIFMTQITRML